MTATTGAVAEDYQFIVERKETCEFVGKSALFANREARGVGNPITAQILQITKDTYSAPMHAYAVGFGSNTGLDEETAYMGAWAKCMDNYEWARTYWQNNNKKPATYLHY